MIDDIVKASGLSRNFEIRSAGVPNAVAVVRNGKRHILYNVGFIQDMNNSAGTKWAAISIMAHEVGHHLNGHTLDGLGSRPGKELEADSYSGFILQKLGASLKEAQVAMTLLANEKGSFTHPGRNDRLAAIASGWSNACELDPDCSTFGRPVKTTEPVKPKEPVKKPYEPTIEHEREIQEGNNEKYYSAVAFAHDRNGETLYSKGIYRLKKKSLKVASEGALDGCSATFGVNCKEVHASELSLIHISEPTRPY